MARRCFFCLSDLERVENYRPKRGIDPHLRKYQCPNCKQVVYLLEKRPIETSKMSLLI